MFKRKNKAEDPEDFEKGYAYAVFLLSLRLRTVGELEEKLNSRGYLRQVIEKIIGILKDNHYVDDQRYAEVFLDNLKKYKDLGYFGIKKKFLLKKLPNKLIDKVLEQDFSKAEELVIAKRVLKKEGINAVEQKNDEEVSYTTFDEQAGKQKQKIIQKLKSRGFRGDVISSLVF